VEKKKRFRKPRRTDDVGYGSVGRHVNA